MKKMNKTIERPVADSVSKKRPYLFSRSPLERMTRLHERLKEGLFPNCNKIAAAFEVSPKTIQRDIDFMRDRLGLPIAYDQHRFGFYYHKKPSRKLPFVWSQSQLGNLASATEGIDW